MIILHKYVRPCGCFSPTSIWQYIYREGPYWEAKLHSSWPLGLQHWNTCDKMILLQWYILMYKASICDHLWSLHVETRLLGRPQPQMYPPVALNQYTLVNRTHKHYIYMLQGPTNILKSHQSSTICKNIEVIWWTFFQIFVFILGGPGEAYIDSRGIKVPWRPHHTGYICTTMKNNG